jgi:hypothetical protein
MEIMVLSSEISTAFQSRFIVGYSLNNKLSDLVLCKSNFTFPFFIHDVKKGGNI